MFYNKKSNKILSEAVVIIKMTATNPASVFIKPINQKRTPAICQSSFDFKIYLIIKFKIYLIIKRISLKD